MKAFKNIIAAGTFDHLHQGHKKFLETAFAFSEFVHCGLTDYQNYACFPEKKLPILIQDFPQRLRRLENYLNGKKYLKRTKFFLLKDRFGPTLEKNEIEGLVVSGETLESARLLNQKRKMLGLEPLEIIASTTIKDSFSQRLSSSNIRLGQVNSQGFCFMGLFPKKTLYLPSNQRHHFKKPLGKLLTGSTSHLSWAALKAQLSLKKNKTPCVVTVGDITTHAFSLHKIPFNLAIIDQKTRRRKHLHLNRKLLFQGPVFKSFNSPGTISPSLTSALQNIFSNLGRRSVLKIEGEEDLTVLPCILLSPLNTLIFYGQPFEGIVKIKVTSKAKEKAAGLLKKFQ